MQKQMNVVFVVYPNIVLLDLAGPLQVFTYGRRDAFSKEAYKTHILSLEGGDVETSTLVRVNSEPLAKWTSSSNTEPLHTLVIIGGDGVFDASQNTVFVDHVKQLAARAKRVCSVCSGAFVLAAADLLDGRRAVTHWEDCERLAQDYPAINVEVDPIYLKDGNVWTSAGITAGIDMALAILNEDLGKAAAIEMARSLVTPIVRSGGQSQFSAELDRQATDIDGRFSDLHDWISNNLHRTISVADMASECGMSSRNFSRRYTQTMGIPPAKALEAKRVNAARDILANTLKSIKTISAECGFQDTERMRRAFIRHFKTSPSQYRDQFR